MLCYQALASTDSLTKTSCALPHDNEKKFVGVGRRNLVAAPSSCLQASTGLPKGGLFAAFRPSDEASFANQNNSIFERLVLLSLCPAPHTQRFRHEFQQHRIGKLAGQRSTPALPAAPSTGGRVAGPDSTDKVTCVSPACCEAPSASAAAATPDDSSSSVSTASPSPPSPAPTPALFLAASSPPS